MRRGTSAGHFIGFERKEPLRTGRDRRTVRLQFFTCECCNAVGIFWSSGGLIALGRLLDAVF